MSIWNFAWNGKAIWMYKTILLWKLNYGYHNPWGGHMYLKLDIILVKKFT